MQKWAKLPDLVDVIWEHIWQCVRGHKGYFQGFLFVFGLLFFCLFVFLRGKAEKEAWCETMQIIWNFFCSRSHSVWMLCKEGSWVDCCQFRGISEESCRALCKTNSRLQSDSQKPSSPYQTTHCNVWHKSVLQKMLLDGGLNWSHATQQ